MWIMSDRLIVTFDKNDDDVPVLLVSKEIFDVMWATKLQVINKLTSNDAIAVYNFLTKKGAEQWEQVKRKL